MLHIAIVEDEAECQEALRTQLERYGKEHELGIEMEMFPDGLDIIDAYRPVWDIIFLDIRMKHVDGMRAAKKIRSMDSAVILIFLTTLGQYAIQGYEVDAMDFILKPVAYRQLEQALKKAEHQLAKRQDIYLMLPDGDQKARVASGEILYIEVQGHNLDVVTEGKTYHFREPLSEMEARLAGAHFARSSNSYLINLKNITSVRKDSVCVGEHELPISRQKKKAFLDAISGYIGYSY